MAVIRPPDRWWVTQKGAAERLGVSTWTIRVMIRNGDLPTVTLGRRQVIRIEDLDRFRTGRRAS